MIPALIGLLIFALAAYAHLDSRGHIGRWDVFAYALVGVGVWTIVAGAAKLWSML